MLNSTATLNPNPLSKLSFNFSSQPEQKLSPQSFEEWRKYIYDLSGIYFQDNKKYLLESRLQKRIKHLKIDTFLTISSDFKQIRRKKKKRNNYLKPLQLMKHTFSETSRKLDALVGSIIPELMTKKTFGIENLEYGALLRLPVKRHILLQ